MFFDLLVAFYAIFAIIPTIKGKGQLTKLKLVSKDNLMSIANNQFTTITIFFKPYSRRAVHKTMNNRYPLSGRKLKKLIAKVKTTYPDAQTPWVNVHRPNGAYEWAFKGKSICRQSVEINI